MSGQVLDLDQRGCKVTLTLTYDNEEKAKRASDILQKRLDNAAENSGPFNVNIKFLITVGDGHIVNY